MEFLVPRRPALIANDEQPSPDAQLTSIAITFINESTNAISIIIIYELLTVTRAVAIR